SDSRKYPWGGYWQEQSANVSYLFGLGGLTPAGNLPDGKSPQGCYNMAGNAKEITDSYFAPYPGCTAKNDKFGEEYIVVRGGSYRTSKALVATYSRDIMKPDETRPDVGFRCAK
ncbi:MAG: SUMF1/EgtB/PvdO family nonheme iron enzyme, partial [Endomicrobiia bacterium]|nr:SUMF1/EgtB/PvdO family nonheme iron enzyme [Endomicrobiia bacterium]